MPYCKPQWVNCVIKTQTPLGANDNTLAYAA